MIPQRNLSLLSNRLAKRGGRRIPEAVLERDYCLAWFLEGLSRHKLGQRLIFKGGTALKRCYFGDYRFSEDLDFTLGEEADFEIIRKELEPVFSDVREKSGVLFQYDRDDRQSHANSHTFYINYDGPLPATAGGKDVKVDITIREKIVFPIEKKPILRGYEEYADLPKDTRVRVYSLQEIAAEKVTALMDRARNEPRDLYDVWHLVTESRIVLSDLIGAIETKLAFRDKQLPDVQGEFKAKEARFKKLWEMRLSAQMSTLPEFEGVYRTVHRAFRQAGLA